MMRVTAGMVSMVGVAVIASAAAVLVIGVVVIIIIIVCIRRSQYHTTLSSLALSLRDGKIAAVGDAQRPLDFC